MATIISESIFKDQKNLAGSYDAVATKQFVWRRGSEFRENLLNAEKEENDPVKEFSRIKFEEYDDHGNRNLLKKLIAGVVELDSPLLIESLKQHYEFINEEQIIFFLTENSYLMATLVEAVSEIGDIFGPRKLLLEYFSDDESVTDGKMYILINCSDMTVRDSLNLLRKLEDSWWLKKEQSIKFLMNIDLEY